MTGTRFALTEYPARTDRTPKAIAYHKWLVEQSGIKFPSKASADYFELGVWMGVVLHQRWQAAERAAGRGGRGGSRKQAAKPTAPRKPTAPVAPQAETAVA